jgi:hypothetical protein
MDATPLEQDEVALATKCTGDWTVAPLPGELTETPAKALGTAMASRHTSIKGLFFTKSVSECLLFTATCGLQ